MWEINRDVILVEGKKNGAIYDLINNKIYSINSIALQIIEKLSNQNEITNEVEIEYINSLKNKGLIGENIRPYVFTDTKEEKTPKLETVWLEITQGCNFRCLHCYEGNEHIVCKDRLTLEEWENIIAHLYSLNVKNIIIIGGEPCVSPYVMPILCECVKYHFNITFFSNLSLLTDEMIEYIIQNNITVKTSLYGYDAQTHDAITLRKGSFDKLITVVKKLVSNGIQVIPAVVIMKENEDCLDKIKERIGDLGLTYRRYDVIRNVFGGTQGMHQPTRQDILDGVCLTKPEFTITKEKFMQYQKCNSCWNGKLVVTENGDVLPCVFERDIILGNIREESISTILDSNTVKRHWNLTKDFINVCKDCEFRYACKDCRPLAKSVCGNLFDKSPRCKYNPYKGEWDI